MPPGSPDLVALYVQILGTLLFCLVFLFLWRQSRIVYFGFWSLAWALQTIALLSLYACFLTRRGQWFIPYTFFEFAFALSLVAAARAKPLSPRAGWKLLSGIAAFLLTAWLLEMLSSFQAFQAMHALVLGSIYLYSFFAMRGDSRIAGIGARLFRFTLLCLSVAFLYDAVVFFSMPAGGSVWRYPQYNNLYDFALHTLLAFSAMTIWIENQNNRIQEMGDQLDSLRRESLARLDLDRLTGLMNQAALSKRTGGEGEFSGVVAVCDMDNFKAVNDRYGHLIGDEILRNIGNLLRSSIRQEDEAFRWGGDEFVILFRNQRIETVRSRMREIQQRLKEFRVRGHGVLPISFSWGTAEAAGRPLREIVHEADQNMYVYKRRKSPAGQRGR